MGAAEPDGVRTSRFIVDGVESGVARLEAPDGKVFTVPSDWLPGTAAEGDTLSIRGVALTAESCMSATVDTAARRRREEDREAELERLRNAEPGEDLNL